MSASVWFREVNDALIKEVRDTVKYRDAVSGSLVSLKEGTGVIIRKPEEDFKLETFPCVSIYNLYYQHDSQRYNPNPVMVSKDTATRTAVMEKSAVSFNLTYQFDFWAKYMSDMDDMTRTWLMNHFRQFNLNVTDDGGTPRSCNVFSIENPKKNDLLVKNDRLFRTIFTYRIWVEIDDEIRYNTSIVTTRDLSTRQVEEGS